MAMSAYPSQENERCDPDGRRADDGGSTLKGDHSFPGEPNGFDGCTRNPITMSMQKATEKAISSIDT